MGSPKIKYKYMKIKNLILVFLLFAAVQMTAQDEKKYTTYIVKSGETLRSIAKKVGCKYREIKNLNPDVDKKRPPVNTTLVIPNKNYGKLVIKDLKPVKNEIYYLVEPGNTFFSIAKKYNVPILALKEANPITSEGLKPGMRLRIPSQDEFTIKPKASKLKLYEVKKGDTKWNIASKNEISVAELERINPTIKKALKVGDKIWIPATENISEDDLVVDESLFIYHVVQQGEGLFRIAVMYDTTQEKIKEMNPEATKKLRTGMLLKIPAKKKDKFLTHEVVKGDNFFNLTHRYEVSEADLLALNPNLDEGIKLGMLLKIKPILVMSTPKLEKNLLIDSISYSRPIQVSFLMPLKLNKKVANSKKDKQLRNISTDFYMGAEIAIDSLRKQGLQVQTHVYDTENNPTVLYNILQYPELQKSDIIIGPFFMGNAKRVAEELPNTPIFTPSNKNTYNSNSNLIKASVTETEITNSLTYYLKEKHQQEKIIIIPDTLITNITKANRIKQLLLEQDSIKDITIIAPTRNKKKPDQVYMDKKNLQKSIKKNGKTWVILVSDIKIISSDIVNTYGVLAKDNKIQLFTTKVFDSFEHIDYQMLGNLSWSFPTTQFTDLSNNSVANFKRKYNSKNYTQPSKYSFTGFDITYDSLIRFNLSDDFTEGLEAGISTRLSQKFDYQTINNSYNNKGVLMITFNKDLDYTLLE